MLEHVVQQMDRASSGAFTFVTARELGGSAADGEIAASLAAGAGSFAIAGLLPGTCLIEARSSSDSEFASTAVVVNGADVADVVLTLSKGATARGQIPF